MACSRCSHRSASSRSHGPARSRWCAAPSSRSAEQPAMPLERTSMAKIYYDRDADLSLVRDKRVAIVGFGSQGHAHAQNLADSGVSVKVGLPPTSKSIAKAKAAGLDVASVGEAAAWADVVMILAPDTAQPALYADSIAPSLAPGKTLMFAHGFNIRFGTID